MICSKSFLILKMNHSQSQPENINEERIKLQKKARDFESSPWIFFVRKSKLTYLIIIFLLIFGITTIQNIPKELNPEVQIPYAVVVTAYPGASPADVEEQITKKIESKVGDLEGVKNLTSNSSLGVSSITVEFQAGENLDTSIRKLKDKVDEVNDLPDDATVPSVVEVNINDQPIFTAALSGDQYDITEIKKFADNVKDSIKGIPYVSDVKVIGGRQKEIRVDIDAQKLSGYGLGVNQVISQIAAANVDFPIGSVTFDNYNYSVRLKSQFEESGQIANLKIADSGGRPVYLEDVAEVKDDLGKETSRSRLSIGGNAPEQAVSIQVYKRTGGDITAVSREAKARLDDGRGVDYPGDLKVETTLDLASYITDSINTLSSNGLQTVILILILLFFFLGWKEALIAGLSVPFSFFVAFITMSLLGESLNFLSLFSLVLALGLLVDSAVVIVEGMYEKVARYGISGYQSAIVTIEEYASPLLSGMLTTVAAFVPLLFVIGIFGEFIKTIPVVVVSTLTAALFVSLTIIPAVGARFMNPVKTAGSGASTISDLEEKNLWRKICRRFRKICRPKPREKRIASRIFNWGAAKYYAFLPKIVGSKKNRSWLIGGVWVLLIASFILPVTGALKIQSFVPSDAEYFFINLKMPNGTKLEKTDETAKKVENVLRKDPEVTNFVTSVGANLGLEAGSGGSSASSENSAFIQVNLTKKDERNIKSYDIVKRIRAELDREVTEGEVDIQEQESGPPTGSAVEVRVYGDDLLILSQTADKIKNELANIPTVIDAKTSVNESAGELVFIPNRQLLASNGLSAAAVGLELRNGVNRNTDQDIKKSGDDITISVGFSDERLKTIEGLKDIPIKTPAGKTLHLSELGTVEFQPSLSSIRHYQKERIVTVSAGTEGGNPTDINNTLKEKIAKMDIPAGYRVDFGGETQDLQETFQDMFMKMIIGIILILFILIIQFNSYRQVSIILFTIPLAMIGVIWGMALTRLTIDIPSFIGIVSLAGIVVNNAIILIDEINREIGEGKDLIAAVSDAGRTRLRPVFLTTITTVFGLLPLSITQPDWRNMGFTIIFGLTFSTFLTLVVVPAMYVSFYRKKMGKSVV